MRQLQNTYLVSVNSITGDIHNILLCCRKDHIAIANVENPFIECVCILFNILTGYY